MIRMMICNKFHEHNMLIDNRYFTCMRFFKKFVTSKPINTFSFFFFCIYIYTFKNKKHDQQVCITLYNWDLNQQEPFQRGY